MIQDIQKRIDVVNQIIEKIASLDRQFFNHKDTVSKIELRSGKLYMFGEYSKIWFCVEVKDYTPSPSGFTHGGTIWRLTKEFVKFIREGKPNEYSGLFSPHWGYSAEAMQQIQALAVELGYLKN